MRVAADAQIAAEPTPLELEELSAGVGPRDSVLRSALRTTRGRVGAGLALLVILIAAIGPLVAPHSPTELVGAAFAKPSSAYPLGTDTLGRDVVSRTLKGGWELLVLGFVGTAAGILLGATIGVVAAFRGGFLDAVLMRGVDVVLAFPQLVFALLLVSVVGPKLWLVVLAVAVAHAPQVARVIRSAALDVAERDFVSSAELIALPQPEIIFSEILPNLTSPLMVETGLRLTYSIIIIAGLSFLGFGLQPPDPNWGVMINENRVGLSANPWAIVAPAVLIALLTVGINTLTDAIARVSLGVEGRRSAAAVVPARPPALEVRE
jgi:peptide/nickel transport system permease protein